MEQKNKQAIVGFDETFLPDETILKIFRYLDLKTLEITKLMSRRWRNISFEAFISNYIEFNSYSEIDTFQDTEKKLEKLSSFLKRLEAMQKTYVNQGLKHYITILNAKIKRLKTARQQQSKDFASVVIKSNAPEDFYSRSNAESDTISVLFGMTKHVPKILTQEEIDYVHSPDRSFAPSTELLEKTYKKRYTTLLRREGIIWSLEFLTVLLKIMVTYMPVVVTYMPNFVDSLSLENSYDLLNYRDFHMKWLGYIIPVLIVPVVINFILYMLHTCVLDRLQKGTLSKSIPNSKKAYALTGMGHLLSWLCIASIFPLLVKNTQTYQALLESSPGLGIMFTLLAVSVICKVVGFILPTVSNYRRSDNAIEFFRTHHRDDEIDEEADLGLESSDDDEHIDDEETPLIRMRHPAG